VYAFVMSQVRLKPGTILSIELSPSCFGVARVTRGGDEPTIEAVSWFGQEPGGPEQGRGKVLSLPRVSMGYEKGPVRYSLLDRGLAKGIAVVGYDAKLAKAGKPPHLLMGWRDIRRAMRAAWALQAGKQPDAVRRKDALKESAAKAALHGLSPKVARIREHAREVVTMWRGDEYDNFKDVVSDLCDLLPATAAVLPKEFAALSKVKGAVVREMKSEAKHDASFVQDAASWTSRLERAADRARKRMQS
jgi:hypothetical protein